MERAQTDVNDSREPAETQALTHTHTHSILEHKTNFCRLILFFFSSSCFSYYRYFIGWRKKCVILSSTVTWSVCVWVCMKISVARLGAHVQYYTECNTVFSGLEDTLLEVLQKKKVQKFVHPNKPGTWHATPGHFWGFFLYHFWQKKYLYSIKKGRYVNGPYTVEYIFKQTKIRKIRSSEKRWDVQAPGQN